MRGWGRLPLVLALLFARWVFAETDPDPVEDIYEIDAWVTDPRLLRIRDMIDFNVGDRDRGLKSDSREYLINLWRRYDAHHSSKDEPKKIEGNIENMFEQSAYKEIFADREVNLKTMFFECLQTLLHSLDANTPMELPKETAEEHQVWDELVGIVEGLSALINEDFETFLHVDYEQEELRDEVREKIGQLLLAAAVGPRTIRTENTEDAKSGVGGAGGMKWNSHGAM
uniref:Uncharacterized protein n=1 Tax=Rhodosorus marinus TaxID=101924 RepID=A0A7S2ZZ01_9RHOD|mmetsp:Transcript_38119/g.151241  ORF Transcript_38119/g.151241 Transcript_38119/m.151241 type:complete len:227 (+) Transcript_38119:446-1126(+)|eukprot:CAMPEP_0113964946 /NCGR_PEP_ID=MMETSP0011_2-20120614/7461_1 /TAXON_ID=101924 /ORGANISM="Rhodosorus marinus" /LENGTH=226 /DNA_ID=CAMNT_0000977383 /DNA_START=312 /DNA_END=992 /DNA_ORIENTATION=- /assembly_acc=CAM_ASM_000156